MHDWDQTKTWTDSTGHTYAIEGLELPYVSNIIGYLERHAVAYHLDACLAAVEAASFARGEAAVYHATGEAESICSEDPFTWLHEQPLMTALVARRDILRG